MNHRINGPRDCSVLLLAKTRAHDNLPQKTGHRFPACKLPQPGYANDSAPS